MIELPSRSGAYRWLYVDFTAGEWSAVAIFMVGNIFSPAYSVGVATGARPTGHSAVNFALYQRGIRRKWVLTEYPSAQLRDGLLIGRSSWRSGANAVEVRVADRTAPWGRAAEATIEFERSGEPGPELQLVEGQPHWWRPVSPRARARLVVPELGLDLAGRAYHDENHGDEQLGGGLPGWRWSRTHGVDETRVVYEPPGGSIHVTSRDGAITVNRAHDREGLTSGASLGRSGWGLSVPQHYGGATPRLLESSPFYARLEATTDVGHTLGEVADFRRFHHPLVRWMANFRMRTEASP